MRGLNPAEPDYALQKALGVGAQALAATRSITIGTAGGGTSTAGGTSPNTTPRQWTSAGTMP
jgi:hypothetical protein